MASPDKQERSTEKKAARKGSGQKPKKPYTRADFDRDLPVIQALEWPEGYTTIREFIYR